MTTSGRLSQLWKLLLENLREAALNIAAGYMPIDDEQRRAFSIRRPAAADPYAKRRWMVRHLRLVDQMATPRDRAVYCLANFLDRHLQDNGNESNTGL